MMGLASLYTLLHIYQTDFYNHFIIHFLNTAVNTFAPSAYFVNSAVAAFVASF